MEDGKRIVKLHFDKEHAAAYLSAALIASQGALEIAFKNWLNSRAQTTWHGSKTYVRKLSRPARGPSPSRSR
jgi:hypothetical protein